MRSLLYLSTDETDIGISVQSMMIEAGYDLTWFPQSHIFDSRVQEATPDFVILDSSPGLGGLESLRKLREVTSCPVLIISSSQDESEIITALAWGGDDYLVKPFSLRELLARVRALLRRVERQEAPSDTPRTKAIRHKNLFLDLGTKKLSVRDRAASLTVLEFFILRMMMATPARCFTREELLELPFQCRRADSRAVDVHIGNLRKKIVALGVKFTPFVAVRGVGYCFDPSTFLTE